MIRGLSEISFVIALVIIAFPAYGKKHNDDVQSYLETKINRDKVVEGEMLIYEVVLHTPDPNIVGIELEKNPSFKNLPVSRAAADNNLMVAEDDGIKFYSAVIDRFFIEAAEVGKQKLEGGSYNIGYGRKVQMQDPFWGPYLADRVEVTTLTAPDLNINIVPLPTKDRPNDFSGAVGNFTIEVELPSGDIHPGDEAIAIITIEGDGDLSRAALPDVMTVFSDNLKFRSMTETRNHFVKESVIGSEIEIECTFIPVKEGEYVLGECSFSYYNPVSRKYERARSAPVSVKVISSGINDNKHSPAQYMDI
ncbi:MAG: protein BatD [Bacteroides sp.]|nr:protein BatD [Bacteroides sp.]